MSECLVNKECLEVLQVPNVWSESCKGLTLAMEWRLTLGCSPLVYNISSNRKGRNDQTCCWNYLCFLKSVGVSCCRLLSVLNFSSANWRIAWCFLVCLGPSPHKTDIWCLYWDILMLLGNISYQIAPFNQIRTCCLGKTWPKKRS